MNFKQPIVLVGPAYPLRGGIAHFNESFARSLMDAGFAVDLVSFYMQYPSILFPGKTQRSTDNPPEKLMINNWLSSVNPISWSNTARKISSLKPQLVIIRFWTPFMAPALGTLAKKLRKRRIRVIGLVDNAIPHEKGKYDERLSKIFFKNCDAFFTLSQSVANDLERLSPGKKIGISPHPIYDLFGEAVSKTKARENLNLDLNKKYILFFGFIRAYKGLDLLLEAMNTLQVKEQNVKLIVAGEFYEDKQKYLNMIEKLKIKNNVIIHSDYIPQEEVKNYFCAVNLVTQTYKSATQSGVTQIAYQFNKPMLVTNVGGLAEIVPHEKCGYVVEPNTQAIANAIARFFNENMEEIFSENVEKYKQRFSWEHFTQKFIEFVESLR